MKYNYLNIYNNLVKLTRNKKLYYNLDNKDTFSDRLIFLFFHLAIFINKYKTEIPKENLQELFDFIIRQIELSIREIGYGDVTINKKMKEYVNLFYVIADKIESLNFKNKEEKLLLLKKFINTEKNLNFYANYLEKYRVFLSNNSLKNFTKDIINLNF
tara:strand:+ start:112 stop:585 length:474 start_codon:yes stop_codon:yes gene_type:complete